MSISFTLKLAVCFLVLTSQLAVAQAKPNPLLDEKSGYEKEYRATVVNVIDADTITVSINLWPGTVQRADIRVRNVDAPETRTKCDAEKRLGIKAANWVKKEYPVGEIVRIKNIAPDPFFGRYVADIQRWRSDRWLYLEAELIERDFGRIWQPKDPDIDWCGIAKRQEAVGD